jgi:hypothetical protein
MAGEVVRVLHDRRRVVAAFRLSRPVVAHLETLVGGGCQVIDIREADGHERLVLAPPASLQLLGKLHAAFPDARVLVVELTDLEHDVRLAGPVTRALDAGADAYLVARSLEELAALMRNPDVDDVVISTPAELPTATEQGLMAQLDDLIARRARSESNRNVD